MCDGWRADQRTGKRILPSGGRLLRWQPQRARQLQGGALCQLSRCCIAQLLQTSVPVPSQPQLHPPTHPFTPPLRPGSFIGGADNLSELESSGQLTARLGA